MSHGDVIPAVLATFESCLQTTAAQRFAGTGRLMEALRYAILGNGKRVRPLMALLSCHAVSGETQPAMTAALALEFIHTYSLVHDDLPCMDDDNCRRGRPTLHVAFDEPTALLVGDALLTEAFALLSEDPEIPDESPHTLSPAQRLKIISTVAAAAGPHGMVEGQMMDLLWTGRGGAGRSDLDTIHQLKTGCLLQAAAASGAIAGGASTSVVESLRRIGSAVGLAFQIRDDLIDGLAGTGKTHGKDQAQGKLTYLSFMSADEAQGHVDTLTRNALAEVTTLGSRSQPLAALISGLIQRQS